MEEKNKQKKKQVFAQARLGVGTRVWTVGRAGEKEAGLGVRGGGAEDVSFSSSQCTLGSAVLSFPAS